MRKWWRLNKYRWAYLLPATGCAAAIVYLSVLPQTELPAFSLSDKTLHGVAYAVLSALTSWGIWFYNDESSNERRFMLWITTGGSCFLFGSGLEIIQHFLPTRYFDAYDFIANFVGCLLGSSTILFSSIK